MQLRDFDCVLLDLDGTLYHAGKPIPGAPEALARLRSAGLSLRFVTNTFATPPEGILERLRGFGFSLDPAELLTPRRTLAAALAARPEARVHAFIADRIRAQLDFLPPQAEDGADIVFVGDADEAWSYESFDRLLGFLLAGAELLVTSPSTTFFGKDGRAHLDTGSVAALLQVASGTTARFLGKPSAELGRLAVASAGASPARTLVAGDDPSVDLTLAAAIGAASVLVETGKGGSAQRSLVPGAVIPSIAELPAFLGLR